MFFDKDDAMLIFVVNLSVASTNAVLLITRIRNNRKPPLTLISKHELEKGANVNFIITSRGKSDDLRQSVVITLKLQMNTHL